MPAHTTQTDLQECGSRKTGVTIFIDMMSVRGHVTLNTFYLVNLCDRPVLYVAADIGDVLPDVQIRPLGLRPCGPGLASRVMTAFRVLLILLAERPQQAVFLSYDLALFALISRVAAILGMRLVCFEHNTAPRTRAKRLLHRLMARNVTRLVYAPHIQDIYTRAGISTIHVPHPCIRPVTTDAKSGEWASLVEGCADRFQRIAFSPSASVSLDSIEALAEQDPDTLFVCKSGESSDLPNVLCHPYFKDYVGALAKCDLVCLPFALDHKVSGPAFEAIAMGKPVMLLPNAFGCYVKQVFPAQVLFPGDTWPETKKDHAFTRAHNSKIIQTLSALISYVSAEAQNGATLETHGTLNAEKIAEKK